MANNSLEQLSLHTIGGGWGAEIADTTNNIRVSVIRGTDIPRLRVGDFSSVPVRYESAAKVKSRLLKPGDIVVEVSGGSAASGQHTGRALLITQQMVESLGGNVIPASFCRLLRLDSRRVNSRFIVYQIDALHLSGEISEFENQSTGIANFQFTRFIQETYPCIEDLQTQSAIAHILGTLDDKIELLRRQNETLEAMARALFKAWFVDFAPVRAKMEGRWQRGQSLPGLPAHLYDLFPDRLVDSELGEIPEGWEVCSFSDVVEIIGGGTPKTSVSEYWGGDIPWFSVVDTPVASDVFVVQTEKSITQAGLERSSARLVSKGTTIISARGTVGNLAIAGCDMTFNQSCYALKGKNGSGCYFVFLSAQRMVEQLKAMAHGSVFSTITRQTFDAVRTVLPPEKVLQQFEENSASVFDRILGNVNESRTLAQLRDTLLPKLISGELRVPDAERIVGGAV